MRNLLTFIGEFLACASIFVMGYLALLFAYAAGY